MVAGKAHHEAPQPPKPEQLKSVLWGLEALETQTAFIRSPECGDGLSVSYGAMAAAASKSSGSEEGPSVSPEEGAKLLLAAETQLFETKVQEAIRSASEAHDIFRSANYGRGVADALRLLARCFIAQERLKFAAAMVQEERQTFHETGDTLGEAKMLLSSAEALTLIGDIETAEADANEALSMFRELNDVKMEGLALLALSWIWLGKGADRIKENSEQAGEFASDALECFQDVKDYVNLGRSLLALASASSAMLAHAEARRALNKALEVFNRAKQSRWEACTLQSMALCHLAQGENSKALRRAEEALDAWHSLPGSYCDQALCVCIQVRSLSSMNRAEDALTAAMGNLRRLEKIWDADQASILCVDALASAHMANGNFKAAVAVVRGALKVARVFGCKRTEAKLLKASTMLQLQGADKLVTNDALQCAEAAVSIRNDLGNEDDDGATAVFHVAGAHLAKGNRDEALRIAEEGRQAFRKSGNLRKEAASLLTSSSICYSDGEHDHAGKFASEALRCFQQAMDLQGEVQALTFLCQIQMQRGKFKEAMRAAEMANELLSSTGDRSSRTEILLLHCQVVMMRLHDMESVAQDPEAVAVAEDLLRQGLLNSQLAVSLAIQIGEDALLAHCLYICAQFKLARGMAQEALADAIEAEELFQNMRLPADQAHAFQLISSAHKALGQEDEARSASQQVKAVLSEAPRTKAVLEAMTSLLGGGAAQKAVTDRTLANAAAAEEQSIVPVRPRKPKGVTDLSGLVGAELLAAKIKEVVHDLGIDEAANDTGLMEMGMTSSQAMAFRNNLGMIFQGANVPTTVAFDYPNIRSISEFVHDQMSQALPAPE